MNWKMQRDGLGLCGSCSYGKVTRDDRGLVEVKCYKGGGVTPQPIRRPLAECSMYYQRDRTTRADYEELAWMVRADKKGMFAGFTRPYGE